MQIYVAKSWPLVTNILVRKEVQNARLHNSQLWQHKWPRHIPTSVQTGSDGSIITPEPNPGETRQSECTNLPIGIQIQAESSIPVYVYYI